LVITIQEDSVKERVLWENNHGVALQAFTILTSFLSPIYAEEVFTTPNQVVGQWLQSYPHDLPSAVTFTSPDFREDLSPDEWITHKESILRQIRFQYLDKQFLKEEIDENRAVIKVKVWISTILGEQIQVEQYELSRYCSVWLLEKVSVIEERFLGHTM